jgi:hypothetical protein
MSKLITFIFLLTTFLCNADFPDLPIKERTTNAMLVVAGKVVSIESIKFPDEQHPRKVAILRIDKVEKGISTSNYLLVTIGVYWPNNIKSSQDMNLKLYDEGKWLLNKDKTGLFILTSPDNFIKQNK